jgi:hypothetical protein
VSWIVWPGEAASNEAESTFAELHKMTDEDRKIYKERITATN